MTGTRLLALVLGFWVLMRSVNADATGRTLIDHILGNKATKSPLLNSVIPSDAGTPNSSGQVNPFPGATGSRLDQGLDLTAKDFLAPFTGRIVVADQSSSGWAGGGYLAIQNANNPNDVVFMAEGLAPVVTVGQTVQAGQRVGIPRTNPYNGILGNIESGPANPANPRQPLAQVAANKPGVVEQFYNWLRSLGGPVATSTAGAGYP